MVNDLQLFIGLGASVVAGCIVPNRWLPALPNDKLMHFVAFAGLAALSLRLADDWNERLLWAAALVVAGWLIECVQGRFVPGRHFCWRDVAANTAGVGFVTGCAWLYHVATG